MCSGTHSKRNQGFPCVFCCAARNVRRQYVAFSIFQLKTILRDIDGEERLCAGSAAEKPRSKQTLSQLKENPS